MVSYEPRHDKTNKMVVGPAKTQISLGIRPDWSVFAVRMKKAGVLTYPLSAQRRLWSDCADTQADLSSLGAHTFCWFCHALAYIYIWIVQPVATYVWCRLGKNVCKRHRGIMREHFTQMPQVVYRLCEFSLQVSPSWVTPWKKLLLSYANNKVEVGIP